MYKIIIDGRNVANDIDVDGIMMKDSWVRIKNILFLSRIHVKNV